METEKKNEEKKKKMSFAAFIRYLLQGHILEDFVAKQSLLLFLIFALIILFITNRYWCSKQLTEMDKLKRELTHLNEDQWKLTRQFTEISMQLQIEESLKNNGIDLKRNNATIYQINK